MSGHGIERVQYLRIWNVSGIDDTSSSQSVPKRGHPLMRVTSDKYSPVCLCFARRKPKKRETGRKLRKRRGEPGETAGLSRAVRWGGELYGRFVQICKGETKWRDRGRDRDREEKERDRERGEGG